ncbi:MAG: FGGY family carbohydrate kinase [Mycobacterium sp.]
MSRPRSGRSQVVCGVDIGSTNTKVVAVDPRGVVVARRWRTTPRRADDASIDALALLDAIEELVIDLCADTHVVRAVSVAGVGEDGVLVDEALTPLTPALAWFDPRRTALYRTLAPQLVPSTQTCTADDAARSLVGWRWAAAHPDAARARTWLALTDFPSSVWSGVPFMSDTIAARTAAWRAGTRDWADDRVAASLGSAELLPLVKRGGDVVGTFASSRLSAAGVVHPEAVVVAGGHDHPVGGWGVHQMDPHSILDSMGTAEVVVAQASTPGVARTTDVDVAPGIFGPGTTVLCVEELARNVQWAANDAEVGRYLDAIIAGDQRPDEYLHEPVFVPGARGGGGPRFTANVPCSPLSRASAVIGAMARLGGIAERAVAQHLPDRPRVYAAGGWSRSPGWMAAKEAVTGCRLTIIGEPQVTAAGAALLAAAAIGWTPSPSVTLGMADDAAARTSAPRPADAGGPAPVRDPTDRSDVRERATQQ